MTHEEAVERVALTICEAEYGEGATVDLVHIKQARAAMAKMLAILSEPTHEMRTMAENTKVGVSADGMATTGRVYAYEDLGNDAGDLFRIMLAASPLAVKEGER